MKYVCAGAGADLRIEPAGLCRGREGGLQQPAVAQRMREAGEQLGIRGAFARATQQADHRLLGAPEIDFEVRVDVLRSGEVRIELERTLERDLRLAQSARWRSASTYLPIIRCIRPSPAHAGRVVRIVLHALLGTDRARPASASCRGSSHWRAGTARRRRGDEGTSCFSIRRSRVVSGSESDSTILSVSSSWRRKRSPTGTCAVWDHSTVAPDGFDELR